ncbi:MAG: FHA domain-containing protein [Myxococcales bacterium]|nr:FHA domain-containing protein [Myxococcales bacterium]
MLYSGEHGNFVIRDVSGSGRTLVNGAPVRERVLADGDMITLGGLALRFRDRVIPADAPWRERPIDLRPEAMTPTREAVLDFIREIRGGRTPAALREALAAHPPRRAPSAIGRWWARHFGASPDLSVTRLELFQDGGFFRRACLFAVTARDPWRLPLVLLPGGGSCGLFALGPEGVEAVTRAPTTLARLLVGEDRSLAEYPLDGLCELLLSAFERVGDIVERLAGPAALDLETLRLPGTWTLDEAERDRLAPELRAPSLSGEWGVGWRIEFDGISLPRIGTKPVEVLRWTFWIDAKPTPTIRRARRVLSRSLLRRWMPWKA